MGEKAMEMAERLGRAAGTALGSWVEVGDGIRVVGLDANGDPAFWDGYGSPLAGEWADDYLVADLANDLEEAEDYDIDLLEEYADAYEQAHADGWRDEVVRRATYQITGE